MCLSSLTSFSFRGFKTEIRSPDRSLQTVPSGDEISELDRPLSGILSFKAV